MTTFLLIRHATCDPIGQYLAGRASGVPLNAEGRSEAARLAHRLAAIPVDAIYSSPLERTRETADAIAAGRELDVQIADELIEIEVAEWTGQTFTDLEGDARWHRFNALRSVARAASGELMLDVQARAVSFVERLRVERPEARVALVSHGDVIRGLVAHACGIPLDLFQRIDIDTASVSVLDVTEHGLRMRCINLTERLPL